MFGQKALALTWTPLLWFRNKEVPTLPGPLFLIFEEVISNEENEQEKKNAKMVFQQIKVKNPLNLFKTNPTPWCQKKLRGTFPISLSCSLVPLDLGKLRLKFSGHHPFLSGYTIISFCTSTESPITSLLPGPGDADVMEGVFVVWLMSDILGTLWV